MGLGHLAALWVVGAGGALHWSVAALCVVPMGLDWAAQEWLAIESTNLRRLLTGAWAGLGVGALFWSGLWALVG